MAPRKPQKPEFGTDMRAMNLLDGLADRSVVWWVTSSLAVMVITLGFFVWDTRGDNRRLRDAMNTYMAADRDVLLRALINNTAALEQNTRTIQKLAMKGDFQ